MTFKISAQSVSVFPFADGQTEVALTDTSVADDFAVLATSVTADLSANCVTFRDLNGRLWRVETDTFHIYSRPFAETLLRPADRCLPELSAERRIYSPDRAAALFA